MTASGPVASFNPEFESLTCFDCGAHHEIGRLHSVCESCGLPLQVNMRLKPDTDPASVIDPSIHSLWRYSKVLPVLPEAAITLTEGWTPLVQADEQTWVKDEARNPTGSFKARGMSMGVSAAVALGARRLVAPSAGNAAGALIGVWGCSRRGGAGGDARGHPAAVRRGMPTVRGTGGTGPRHHRRLGQVVGRAPVAARLRPFHAQGAIPRRGQEDDGVRVVGAVRRRPARRDRLPDRRRDRPGRDVEGLRRDGGHGMDRGESAPTGIGAIRRVCPRGRGIQDEKPSHRALARSPDHGLRAPGPQPHRRVHLPARCSGRPGARRLPSRNPTSRRLRPRCPPPRVSTPAPRQGRHGPRSRLCGTVAGSGPRNERSCSTPGPVSSTVEVRQRPSVRGSRTSRKPSPTRLNESAHRNTIRPGKVEVHQRPAMMSAWPSLTRVPHSA